jgi:LAO/AO transport system kinase
VNSKVLKSEAEKILQGNQLAAARLIRLLEEGAPDGVNGLKYLYPHTGKAFIVGITGPPGSGKSTLVTEIITEFRQRGLKVGVVAVDPSSPFSGGALLGDRLRMRRHTEDQGVFIRSMATRGHMGGLSRTTRETVLVLDAMGHDIILIETVGVGQDEVEVNGFAHTIAVVSLPGMGDEIQVMKAGLLEIGDVFVVNKADKPGADEMVDQLRLMLQMRAESENTWNPPIIKTTAITGEGVPALADAFGAHRRYLVDSGRLDKSNVDRELKLLRRLVTDMAVEKLFNSVEDLPAYKALLEDLKNRRTDPYSAAEVLVNSVQCKI